MAQMVRRVLLARIGWMTYYGRIEDHRDRLVGGGSFNDQNQGSELYNFKVVQNRLYGFVQSGRSGSITLSRIHGKAVDGEGDLGGVTVIFVATDRNAPRQTERQRIVGWYKNATVYRDCGDNPTGTGEHYNLLSSRKDAWLLPTRLRTQPIPRAKGAMGQSNVWYPLDEDGKLRNPPWLVEALQYVNSYNADNLVENPGIELAQAAQIKFEETAGFESDARIREAVEDHAMKIVKRHYLKDGFNVEDKHKTQPYDFKCSKGGLSRYVEVKGTQTLGTQVLLTPNEVILPDRKDAIVDLCVVHSVNVTRAKEIVCSGGKLTRYEKWHPRDHRLRPISFLCELTKQPFSAKTV